MSQNNGKILNAPGPDYGEKLTRKVRVSPKTKLDAVILFAHSCAKFVSVLYEFTCVYWRFLAQSAGANTASD